MAEVVLIGEQGVMGEEGVGFRIFLIRCVSVDKDLENVSRFPN